MRGKGTQVDRPVSIYPPGFPSLEPLALQAVLAGNDKKGFQLAAMPAWMVERMWSRRASSSRAMVSSFFCKASTSVSA